MRITAIVTILVISLVLLVQSRAYCDYTMPGADVERTSWLADTTNPTGMTAQWHREFAPGEGFIPAISHIITVTHTGTPDLHYIYVSTSQGVYCLDADDSGSQVWFYQTVRPVGHSVTVVNGVAYIPCFDKRVHAVNAVTGQVVWTSDKMGAGFRANPLVVNSKVYVGCRDGKFYCLDAADGGEDWSYDTHSVINYSACYYNGVVYFGDMRMYAYALDADDGAEVWVSEQLEGDGFYGYWPVIYQDRVIFSGSACYMPYGTPKLVTASRDGAWPGGLEKDDPPGPVDGNGWIDATTFVNYITANPDRRTFFVLNQSNGARNPAYTPILWVGNASGCRYPPLVRPSGNVYAHDQFKYSATESAAQGWLVEWQLGTPYIRNVDYGTAPELARSDVVDEPDAWLGTTNYVYYHHHSARGAGWMRVDGSGNGTIYGSNISLEADFPGYNSNWFNNRRYGDPASVDSMQAHTHGYQNPPIPFNNALYMHCSNAVLCYGN